jgi:hypothetical protein
MNSPFTLSAYQDRCWLIEYAALRDISVSWSYSMTKQITYVIKRITYALDKLKIGESITYATLAMKATILYKSGIKLDWYVVAYIMRNLFSCKRLYEITKIKR